MECLRADCYLVLKIGVLFPATVEAGPASCRSFPDNNYSCPTKKIRFSESATDIMCLGIQYSLALNVNPHASTRHCCCLCSSSPRPSNILPTYPSATTRLSTSGWCLPRRSFSIHSHSFHSSRRRLYLGPPSSLPPIALALPKLLPPIALLPAQLAR